MFQRLVKLLSLLVCVKAFKAAPAAAAAHDPKSQTAAFHYTSSVWQGADPASVLYVLLFIPVMAILLHVLHIWI